jgi:hypothetical protein
LTQVVEWQHDAQQHVGLERRETECDAYVSLTNTVGLLKVRQSATWKSNGFPDIKRIL